MAKQVVYNGIDLCKAPDCGSPYDSTVVELLGFSHPSGTTGYQDYACQGDVLTAYWRIYSDYYVDDQEIDESLVGYRDENIPPPYDETYEYSSETRKIGGNLYIDYSKDVWFPNCPCPRYLNFKARVKIGANYFYSNTISIRLLDCDPEPLPEEDYYMMARCVSESTFRFYDIYRCDCNDEGEILFDTCFPTWGGAVGECPDIGFYIPVTVAKEYIENAEWNYSTWYFFHTYENVEYCMYFNESDYYGYRLPESRLSNNSEIISNIENVYIYANVLNDGCGGRPLMLICNEDVETDCIVECTSLDRVYPTDIVGGDFFAKDVDVNNNICVIGAEGVSDAENNAGAIYFMRYTDDDGWTQFSKQLPHTTRSDATLRDDNLGYSVGVSDNYAIGGAKGDNENGRTKSGTGVNNGAVYVYDKEGNEIEKIIPPDSDPNYIERYYGWNSALTDSYFVTTYDRIPSAPGTAIDKGFRIYRRLGTTWSLIKSVTDPEEPWVHGVYPATADCFAFAAMDCDENYIVVGSPYIDAGMGKTKGKVYIYNSGGTLINEFEKDPVGGGDDSYGASVAIHGEWAVVGQMADDSIHIYKRTGNFWSYFQYIQHTANVFGRSVNIDDNELYIIVSSEDYLHIYELSGGSWTEKNSVDISGVISPYDSTWGESLAIHYCQIVVSHRTDDTVAANGGAFYTCGEGTPPSGECPDSCCECSESYYLTVSGYTGSCASYNGTYTVQYNSIGPQQRVICDQCAWTEKNIAFRYLRCTSGNWVCYNGIDYCGYDAADEDCPPTGNCTTISLDTNCSGESITFTITNT